MTMSGRPRCHQFAWVLANHFFHAHPSMEKLEGTREPSRSPMNVIKMPDHDGEKRQERFMGVRLLECVDQCWRRVRKEFADERREPHGQTRRRHHAKLHDLVISHSKPSSLAAASAVSASFLHLGQPVPRIFRSFITPSLFLCFGLVFNAIALTSGSDVSASGPSSSDDDARPMLSSLVRQR